VVIKYFGEALLRPSPAAPGATAHFGPFTYNTEWLDAQQHSTYLSTNASDRF